MTIDVLFFGILQDLAGARQVVVQTPGGSRVADLLVQLRRDRLADGPVWSSLAVAVNREYASPATELHDGDEVALLPPVSGGACARRNP